MDEYSSSAEAPSSERSKALSSMSKNRFFFLWPIILGLTVGRSGLIAACYGGYNSTDDGVFTDGSMLVSLVFFSVFFMIIVAGKVRVPKRQVNLIGMTCFTIEFASIVAIGAVSLLGITDFSLQFGLSVICTSSSSGSILFWLRRSRGADAPTVVVFVFSALLTSEIILYFFNFIPQPIDLFLYAALSLLQFPCARWARLRMKDHETKEDERVPSFVGHSSSVVKSTQMLIVSGLGVSAMSIVIGLLRGYPHGESIPFEPATRLAYALLTIVISAAIIRLAVRGRSRIMASDIFIAMGVLASLAIISYAAFPNSLDIGAVFTTTLNAIMVATSWYTIVAFMSFGWRDPYFYALSGWFVWLGARSVSRLLMYGAEEAGIGDTLIIAIMAVCTVLSTQITLVKYLNIERGNCEAEKQLAVAQACSDAAAKEVGESKKDQADDAHPTPASPASANNNGMLARIMGLDSGESLEDMRRSSMRHSAEMIGEQFLLSEREVDVLALYALGLTQKRVAEELFITQSTTHAHIKRIYAKTGMHSRQEILDYIAQYAS